MTLAFYSAAAGPEHEQPLPGVQDVAEWALWIFAENWDYEPAEVAELRQAFRPLRGIVWHAQGGAFKSRIVPVGREFFSKSPHLMLQLVSLVTTEYQSQLGKIRSGVAWLSPDADTEVAELLSRNDVNRDRTLAFLPDTAEAAEAWTNVVYGLSWLWHGQKWIGSEPQPKLRADAVILSYIGLTIKIGGVAGLLAHNCDMEKGLVFYGPKDVLEPVIAQLAQTAEAIDAEEFNSWFRKGAEFLLG